MFPVRIEGGGDTVIGKQKDVFWKLWFWKLEIKESPNVFLVSL